MNTTFKTISLAGVTALALGAAALSSTGAYAQRIIPGAGYDAYNNAMAYEQQPTVNYRTEGRLGAGYEMHSYGPGYDMQPQPSYGSPFDF